mgnify:CR=1 FL=1
MNYFKSLGFYFFDWVGGTLNFLCCLIGVYPGFDMGVRFLLLGEAKRIGKEKDLRHAMRGEKEKEASLLKEAAEENG